MSTSRAQGRQKSTCSAPGGVPEVVFSVGIKRADMRRLLAESTERREDFLREWERIHGRRI
jgi:hypothetical protein